MTDSPGKQTHREMFEEVAGSSSRSRLRAAVWAVFAGAALFLLNIDDLVLWTKVVVAFGLALAAILALRPSPPKRRVDARDLLAMGVLYVAVVAAFRVAFIVLTAESVLGLFLSFGVGMILGVVGLVVWLVREDVGVMANWAVVGKHGSALRSGPMPTDFFGVCGG